MAYYESVDAIKKMLPKTYLQRKQVAHEIYVALTHYKYIVPILDNYVFNDGTVKDLMCLSGTIPVMYNANIYNIPVCLWLEENYPETAPICYVKPTWEMMILTGEHITSNGEVLLPYLQEWKHAECDLVSLLQVMTAMFGEFPPVCMRTHSEQASCSQQFHRQTEGLSETEVTSCLCLTRDDGQPFQKENETNC